MDRTKTITLSLSLALAAAGSVVAQQGFFYERGTDELVLVDLKSNVERVIGTLGTISGSVTRLGWRRDNQTLWAGTTTGEIGQIDVVTGAYTPRFQSGLSEVVDIDWDIRNQVFYIKGRTGDVHTLDPVTGTTTALSPFSPLGPYGETFATDGHGGLWGYDNQVYDTLTTIDTGRRTYTKLAKPDTDLIESITIDDKTWMLYCTIDANQTQRRPGIYRLDPVTGRTTLSHGFWRPADGPGAFEVAELPDGFVQEFANFTGSLQTVDFTTGRHNPITSGIKLGDISWDDQSQVLWCLLTTGEIGTIDRFSGAFQRYDTLGSGGPYWGLAWDPTGKFYVSSNDSLYEYDLPTKVRTLIRGGLPKFWSLDLAPDGTLWGFATGGVPYTIDKSTGNEAQHPVGFGVQIDGAAFSPELGDLYFVSPDTNKLYRGDLQTGQLTTIMQIEPGLGLEIVSTPSTGAYKRFGQGCKDASGTEVRLLVTGDPDINRKISARVLQGSGQPYLLGVGASNTTWSGLALPFDLSSIGGQIGCLLRTSLDLLLGPVSAGSGVLASVPNDPSFVGRSTYWQALVVDASLPGPGVATSDMIAVLVGR